ncbi:ATP synthase subunit I [Staphylococcus massiliensis]|nr:ATP synthase subunit I [Staphylococcus massiliensis]
MKSFDSVFKRYIFFYICLVVTLTIIYIFTLHNLVLGLIVGTIASLINTYIFEIYLSRATKNDTSRVSTGSVWRYLVVILACLVWVIGTEQFVSIIGILFGILIAYILIVMRPVFKNMNKN